MWVVHKNLGYYASSMMTFNTKEEAEKYAAKHGGRVMTESQYRIMRM